MMDIACRDAPGLQAVRVFTSRLARRAVLRRSCPSGHPVLAIEDDLIEMARSKLQEHMLSSYPEGVVPALREEIRSAMRLIARERVTKYGEDEPLRTELVDEVCSEPMDVLLAGRR